MGTKPSSRAGLSAALLIVAGWFVDAETNSVVVLDKRPDPDTASTAPVVYWQESRNQPRPLKIHVLRVDLRSKQYGTVALIAEDPDGGGGAEAQLEKPLSLASRSGVIAAINANAFDLFPRPKQGERRVWRERAPVDILGWAEAGPRCASLPQPGLWSFWIDPDGRGHVGDRKTPAKARTAVAGFGSVVTNGEISEHASQPFHPRSALGIDEEGWTMWWAVVDGRQQGYSEGVSLVELASLMKELGCRNAINLDGGGSSIMLLAEDGKALSIMNRPSDVGTRAIPVLLAIRLLP